MKIRLRGKVSNFFWENGIGSRKIFLTQPLRRISASHLHQNRRGGKEKRKGRKEEKKKEEEEEEEKKKEEERGRRKEKGRGKRSGFRSGCEAQQRRKNIVTIRKEPTKFMRSALFRSIVISDKEAEIRDSIKLIESDKINAFGIIVMPPCAFGMP